MFQPDMSSTIRMISCLVLLGCICLLTLCLHARQQLVAKHEKCVIYVWLEQTFLQTDSNNSNITNNNIIAFQLMKTDRQTVSQKNDAHIQPGSSFCFLKQSLYQHTRHTNKQVMLPRKQAQASLRGSQRHHVLCSPALHWQVDSAECSHVNNRN